MQKWPREWGISSSLTLNAEGMNSCDLAALRLRVASTIGPDRILDRRSGGPVDGRDRVSAYGRSGASVRIVECLGRQHKTAQIGAYVRPLRQPHRPRRLPPPVQT